ncbi:hypothetical protein ACFSKW_54785 [Nonomuraea mangrovi]|uniref:Uncharacterized protein n=1 Tax=Nonomuraea mangrovi TaxID=2316207 RepID=A0ABW4TGZ7_9ACTN
MIRLYVLGLSIGFALGLLAAVIIAAASAVLDSHSVPSSTPYTAPTPLLEA